ncbi:MAG: BRcat domain-containing protein [Beduini sp.]|uniref:BRcat domain-containing protein n=1 Tax=Beduini sp. TaxID=1922300 RepID=UPI0039A0BFC3
MKNLLKGRNGPDQLSQFLLFIVLLISLSNLLFFKTTILSILVWVLLIYILYRTFSKQVYKRRQENIKFAQMLYPYQIKMLKWANRQADKKTHRYFKCPNCSQTVRVPKGHGLITITCPKCQTRFDKKS